MKEYDVAIVGAGFAGSILAERLARSGLEVLLLEAGPRLADRQLHLNKFYRAKAKVPGSPWPQDNEFVGSPGVLDYAFPDWQDGEKYYLEQRGPLPFGSTYERLGGGTGNHWQGAALRLVPNDFRMASEYNSPEGAPDWPITYEHLEPWYCDAEHYIGVAGDHHSWNRIHRAHRSHPFPMPELRPTYLDQVLKRRLRDVEIGGISVNVLAHPQARNSIGRDGRPPCMGNANCIPMCPIVAKYDPNVHLERSARVRNTPADIHYQSVAYRIEIGAKDRVTGIRYKTWDSKRGVEERVARARRYVIAANSIETAKLLLMSPWKTKNGKEIPVANGSGHVGRNLMDHVIHLAWGLFDEPVHPYRGPQSTSRINEFRDRDCRNHRAAWILGVSNGGWGWPTGAPVSTLADLVRNRRLYGRALRSVFADEVHRQVHFTAELEQLPSSYNRVTLSSYRDALGLPKPAIRWTISPYTRRSYVSAMEAFGQIFKRIGTEYTEERADKPTSFQYQGHIFEAHGAGHIMGTTRMGTEPAQSVVDRQLRCHDHENLYLVGAGTFPTAGTANPTLTICALALRTAVCIANELDTSVPEILKTPNGHLPAHTVSELDV